MLVPPTPMHHKPSLSDTILTDTPPALNQRALGSLLVHRMQATIVEKERVHERERKEWLDQKAIMESTERIHTKKLKILKDRLETMQDDLDRSSVARIWIGRGDGNSNNKHSDTEDDDLPKLCPGNSEEVITLRQTVSSLKESMARKDEMIETLKAENDRMSMRMQFQEYNPERAPPESVPMNHTQSTSSGLEQEMESRYKVQILNLNGALSEGKSYIETLEAQLSQIREGGYHKKQDTAMRVSRCSDSRDHRQMLKSLRSRVSRSFKSATSFAFISFPYMARNNTCALDIPLGEFGNSNSFDSCTQNVDMHQRSSLAVQLQQYDREHAQPESPRTPTDFGDMTVSMHMNGFVSNGDTLYEVDDESSDSETESLDLSPSKETNPIKQRLSVFRNFLSMKQQKTKSKGKRGNFRELQRMWRSNGTSDSAESDD